MAPFMLARLSEKPAGFGDGNELSAAIERMAQGPRLADVWDIDRKMALAFSAWIEMRQRLASYNAVASAPWTEASKRFLETMSAAGTSETPFQTGARRLPSGAKSPTRSSSAISAPTAFSRRRRSCFRPDLQLRSRQDDVAEAASAMFGLPTRKDFDDVTRQLTELRREVRALARQSAQPED